MAFLYDTQSPHALLRGLPLGDARWTKGFWADRFQLAHESILPSMKKAMEDSSNTARFSYFRFAAGLEEGRHQGTNWSDGDCYKWIEATSHVYGITRDPELDRQMDEAIGWIAAAQEEDGYLCTQIQLEPNKQRWENLQYHELYNMGHMCTAASVHNEATGKTNFLAVATRLADYLYGVFRPRPKELAHFGFNPSQIMGLVDLYRATRNEKYLELAGIFVTMRGSQPGGSDQNQARTSLRNETEAFGHSVTATYLWAGATDVCNETGEQALRDALERIWKDVVTRKIYVNGGVAAHHYSATVHQDRVWEAFGLPHELPNATAYNETCANIGHAMWARRMLDRDGEAEYADMMEHVIYNVGLSGMSLDGTLFCYTNPLRWYGKEHRLLSQDSHERWFTSRCYCCPPQVARTIGKMHRWAYGVSAGALWVHLYGGSRVETEVPGAGALAIEQTTDYPWEGRITIRVDRAPDNELALMVRIPGWTEQADLTVAGKNAGNVEPGTYQEIRRTWSAGDEVVIDLEMEPKLIQAHPRVETARNQVAVKRGPVVYCLEEIDLPAGVPIDQVYMPRDAKLAAEYRPDHLAGVAVIKTTGVRIDEPGWNGTLYRPSSFDGRSDVGLTLIPYYAWRNRGECQMEVWIPAL